MMHNALCTEVGRIKSGFKADTFWWRKGGRIGWSPFFVSRGLSTIRPLSTHSRHLFAAKQPIRLNKKRLGSSVYESYGVYLKTISKSVPDSRVDASTNILSSFCTSTVLG